MTSRSARRNRSAWRSSSWSMYTGGLYAAASWCSLFLPSELPIVLRCFQGTSGTRVCIGSRKLKVFVISKSSSWGSVVLGRRGIAWDSDIIQAQLWLSSLERKLEDLPPLPAEPD